MGRVPPEGFEISDQSLTGYDFSSNVPASVRNVIEPAVDDQ
jgi:hypothetical protein